MTKDELELLRSYEKGPRIWDAAEIMARVWVLEDKGLIEPVDAEGRRYQLTDAGRKALEEPGRVLVYPEIGSAIPPEMTGGMTGFVVGKCGHRVAGSEWAAGFRNCERCGG